MFEIYAYHNSASLTGIFNAVAAIMASGGYSSSLAVVSVCGFFAALVAYAFAPEKLHGWKWLGSVVLVSCFLVVPKVSVGIVDKTGGTAVVKVDNVPLGMALFGGITSPVGNVLTEAFETAFQVIPGRGALPAELAYQKTGLMFGSRLVQEARRVTLTDPVLRADLLNFVHNCTVLDIADGTLSAAGFAASDDLWAMMAATNPARFTPVDGSVDTCERAYASIDRRLPAQVTTLAEIVAGRLNPTLATTAARSALASQIPQAFIASQLVDGSKTAADIIRQNALINAIGDAGQMSCQRLGDPSCMLLAHGRAQAVAQQNAAWITGAKVSEEALPIVRNAAEALTYAVFPIVVLLLMATSGRGTLALLGGYLTVLVSIQLWPPLFAVLNYMVTIAAQLEQAAAAELGGGVRALSLRTADPIYMNAVSAQAVVSWLVIGIPALAYSLASRLVNFASSLAGGLTGLQATVAGGASAAAAGNVSTGNVTLDQRNVTPMTSNPFVERSQDVAGNWTTTDGMGRRAVSFLRNEGLLSHEVTARVTQGQVQEAQKAVTSASGEVMAAATARAATLSDALKSARSESSVFRNSSGSSTTDFQEVSQAADRVTSETRSIASSLGMGESQVATTLFKLSAMPGVGGVGGGAAASKNYQAQLTDDEKRVLSLASGDTLKAARSFGDRVTHDTSVLRAISSESSSGRELASALTSTTTRSEAAERRFSEALSRAETTRLAFERGESFSYDLARDPAYLDSLVEQQQAVGLYGASNPQAISAYLASRLGNYSLHPSRLTGGTALPATFSDVRDTYRDSLGSASLASNIQGIKTKNDSSVSHRRPSAVVGLEGRLHRDVASTALRESQSGFSEGRAAQLNRSRTLSSSQDVRSRREELEKQVQSSYEGFESRHELERRPEGNIVTHGSLLDKTALSVKEDFKTSAKDTAKGLLGVAKRLLGR